MTILSRPLRPVVVAAATAAIALASIANTAGLALASAAPISIAQGVSITPAPGWTLGHRGPNWVALDNADTSAQLRVTVKSAGGTDAVAVLQADIDQLTGTSSAILSNIRNLSEPATQSLQGANFQQEASINYTADVITEQGTIPVIGTFSELLNTSNGKSAFIDFRQGSNATTQAASDGGMMIRSME
jgi:hypothetical protein